MGPTRRRWSWLGVIRVVLSITILLDMVGLVVGVLQLFSGLYPIGRVDFYDLFPQGIPGFAYHGLTFGSVEFFWQPTGTVQHLMFALSNGLGLLVVTLPMLISGHQVATEAMRHDPFTLGMVRQLRKLGLLILIGGALYQAVAIAAGHALLFDALSATPALRSGASLDPHQYLSFWWLLPGLLVLAFAGVIRRGCDLRAELDEVI